MDYKNLLLEKINKLLSSEITVLEFEKEYYNFFLEEVPEGALNEDDNELFAEIQEKLDWTSENPTSEERGYGWINYPEYVKWLRNKIKL